MLRRQLPVHSPIAWTAVLAGAGAAAPGASREALRLRLVARLRERFGARDVLLTDSGTSALRLGIEGAVGATGEPVALPGYTCYDMATAAEGAAVRVALYDVDPRTLGPDLDSLDALAVSDGGAVVVGHLFGHLADVRAVESATRGALVIEDAAQGVGGTLDGHPLGSFGSLSVLSFGRGKGITGGGGGALLAHDDRGERALARIRERLPRPFVVGGGLSRMAVLAGQLVLGRPHLYGVPAALPFLHLGETRYHPPRAPRPMAAASIAVVDRVIALADEALEARTRHATRLLGRAARAPHLTVPREVPGGRPGYLRAPVVCDGARDAILSRAALRLGIAEGYPTTLLALASLRPHLVERNPRLPGAVALAERLVTLPTHGLLTELDLCRIEAWMS